MENLITALGRGQQRVRDLHDAATYRHNKGGYVYRRVMTPLPLLLRADLPEGQERRLDPPLLEPLVVLVGLKCRAGPRELRPRSAHWKHVVERRALEVEVALGRPAAAPSPYEYTYQSGSPCAPS